MVRTVLVLGRMSNLPTVWTNVLAGWFIAGGSWEWELAWLIVGVSLLYVAGMTLNDAFDADWDREHAPERPIPSGAISRKAVWILGFGQLAAGIGVVAGFTDTSLLWLGALVAAILLYDWIHKKTAWAVVVMGACRALVYFLSASAITPGLSVFLAMWAVAMLFYVVGITLAARGERAGKRQPFSLPARLLLYAPIALALVAPVTSLGFENLVTGILVAIAFVILVLLANRQARLGNIGLCVSWLIAGIVLLDAFVLTTADLRVTAVCVCLLPVTLLLQRRIPAT